MTTAAKQIRAYLQLMRLPAVFTAMADIVLGFVLVHQTLSPVSEFVALLGASTALYLAGMVFNDFFDRRLDAEERPNRPIPSGRVSPRSAFTLAAMLTVIGLACALAAGGRALAIAGLLTALILAYDGFFKKTVFGPVAMGGCRFLNVLLGASGAELFDWKSDLFGVAAAMGIYVAGITWFARSEAVRSSRRQLLSAMLVIHGGIILLLVVQFASQSHAATVGSAAVALACVIGFIESRLAPALGNPSPQNVQAAVKRLLLAIVLLDATMVYWKTGNPALGLGTALLIVPAATLGRWIFIT